MAMSSQKKYKRLLLFNLRTDVDDHILGFTTAWINALAPHYEAIDVLTTHAGRIAVADNVRVFSTGREQGYGRPRQIRQFYSQLLKLLLTHRYDACFAHMQPLFAVMAAPLLRLRGVPITTWYTHRQMSRTIAWAERLSNRIVTAVPSSFPLQTPKVHPIGHGIDMDFFAPDKSVARHHPPRIVYVARLTDIKNQHVLIQATKDLNCEVILVGDVPDGYDDRYKRQLIQLVDELGLDEEVIFAGAQTPEQVRDWYRSATLAINISPPGLFDKAALEAMAVGIPIILSNPAFDPLLGEHKALLQISAPDDEAALRDRLQTLLGLDAAEQAAIGAGLRASVSAQHSLEALIPKLIAVMHGEDFTA